MRLNAIAGTIAMAVFALCTARVDPGHPVAPLAPDESVSAAALVADVAQLDSFLVLRAALLDSAGDPRTFSAQFTADTPLLHLHASHPIAISEARSDIARLLAEWHDQRTGLALGPFDPLAQRVPNHYFGAVDQAHILRGRTMRHPTRLPSRWIGNHIAYIRADETLFTEGGAAALQRWFAVFAGARGLVLDLRGVATASHGDLAWLLLPYLMTPGSDPLVLGTVFVRLGPGSDTARATALLRTWHYFAGNDTSLSPADRAAIAGSVGRAAPATGIDFSPPYYLLVRPKATAGTPGGRPVVVLIDARCANACEVVAAALAGLPNVTLLGTRTSGGAGLAERLVLRHTGIAVDVTIARFFMTPSLPLGDSGVAPTIEMPGPDSVHAGTADDRDLVLERAVELARKGP